MALPRTPEWRFLVAKILVTRVRQLPGALLSVALYVAWLVAALSLLHYLPGNLTDRISLPAVLLAALLLTLVSATLLSLLLPPYLLDHRNPFAPLAYPILRYHAYNDLPRKLVADGHARADRPLGVIVEWATQAGTFLIAAYANGELASYNSVAGYCSAGPGRIGTASLSRALIASSLPLLPVAKPTTELAPPSTGQGTISVLMLSGALTLSLEAMTVQGVHEDTLRPLASNLAALIHEVSTRVPVIPPPGFAVRPTTR